MEASSENERKLQIVGERATAVVVQIRPIPCEKGRPFGDARKRCYAAVSEVVRQHGGQVRLLNENRFLGLFTGAVASSGQGIEAAFDVMEQLTALNRNYLSLEKTPMRVGIGVDSSVSDGSPVEKATVLSQLNQQAPFPAIFVSSETMNDLEAANSEYYVQPLETTAAASLATIYALLPAQLVP